MSIERSLLIRSEADLPIGGHAEVYAPILSNSMFSQEIETKRCSLEYTCFFIGCIVVVKPRQRPDLAFGAVSDRWSSTRFNKGMGTCLSALKPNVFISIIDLTVPTGESYRKCRIYSCESSWPLDRSKQLK